MRKLIAILMLVAGTCYGQTALFRTNEVGIGIADHTMTNVQGSFHFNVYVVQAGVPKDISDIPAFSLTVKDTTSSRVMFTIPRDTAEEQNLSQGWLRFVIPSLPARLYELKAVAIPATGTNDQYNIHWGYLEVTQNVSSSSTTYTGSHVPGSPSNGYIGTMEVPWAEVNAVTGRFSGSLIVEGDLDVAGSIDAIDTLARTSSVYKTGDIMTGPLTGTAFYVGSDLLEPLPDGIVTNAGATINGEAISNGAEIVLSTGGLSLWGEDTGTVTQVGDWFYAISTPTHGIMIGTNASLSAQRANGAASGGNARGDYSVDWQSSRSVAASVASGLYSMLGGGNGNRAAGNYSGVSAGNGNIVIDAYGYIGGGANNTINGGDYNFIGGGTLNTDTSSDDYNAIVGGNGNTISEDFAGSTFGFSTILGGLQNAIKKSQGSLVGGARNGTVSNSVYALALVARDGGVYDATDAGVIGRASNVRGATNAWIVGVGQTETNNNVVRLGPWNFMLVGTNQPAVAPGWTFDASTGQIYVCRTNGAWELAL